MVTEVLDESYLLAPVSPRAKLSILTANWIMASGRACLLPLYTALPGAPPPSLEFRVYNGLNRNGPRLTSVNVWPKGNGTIYEEVWP